MAGNAAEAFPGSSLPPRSADHPFADSFSLPVRTDCQDMDYRHLVVREIPGPFDRMIILALVRGQCYHGDDGPGLPAQDKAWSEMHRFLKSGGNLVACLCIKGESRISDWLMHRILSRKGWFTPPFETFASLKERLENDYILEEYHKEGSMVYLKARKK